MMRVRTVISGGSGGTKLHTSYWTAAVEDNAAAVVATSAMGGFWTNVADRISNAMTIAVESLVAVVNPVTGDQTADLVGTASSRPGTNTGVMLPQQAQGGVAISTSTFFAGRRVRGHWNIPGPTESDNDGFGTPSSAYIADVQAAVNALLPPGGPASALVIWSRRNGATAAATTAAVRTFYYTLNSRRL